HPLHLIGKAAGRVAGRMLCRNLQLMERERQNSSVSLLQYKRPHWLMAQRKSRSVWSARVFRRFPFKTWFAANAHAACPTTSRGIRAHSKGFARFAAKKSVLHPLMEKGFSCPPAEDGIYDNLLS